MDKFFALGGNIELGGLEATGTITLNDDFSLSFPENVTRADVFLNNSALVDVSSGGGGNININARNLEFTQGSALFAGIRPNEGNPEAQTGDININVIEEVNLRQGSRIENQVDNNATGNAGNININTNSLAITEGSDIGTSTFGNGNGGEVNIDVIDTISINGFETIASGIYSNVGSEIAVGNAGEIKITTGNLDITNGGIVNSVTFGKGNGGKISVNAIDTILVDGEAENLSQNRGIASAVTDTGIGNAGDVTLQAGSLILQNGGSIDSSNFGSGNAGNIDLETNSLSLEDSGRIGSSTSKQGDAGKITINASDFVSLNNSVIDSQVGETATGNSGGIEINTANLSLTNGGQIDTSTFGEGNAGKIAINASNSISVDGFNSVENTIFRSLIFSEVDDTAKGNSEGIEITTTNLSLTNRGGINSNSTGNGNSGKISINAADTIVVDGGSTIFNAIAEGSNGSSEGIEINTTNLSLVNGGLVDSSTLGQGSAGKINIEAQSLSLEDGGLINSSTSGAGNGGSIVIDVDNAVTITGIREDGSDSSQITTETFGEGNGGSIQITAQSLFLEKGGEINSSSNLSGNGGNITINVDDSVTLNGKGFRSTITASSFSLVQFESGNGGNIEIEASDLVLENGAIIRSGVTGVFSFAKPGNITIDVDDNVTLNGENEDGIASRIITDTNAIEDAGEIRIQSRSLSLENGAVISSSKELSDSGSAGNITIDVDDSVTLMVEVKMALVVQLPPMLLEME
ncbi:MAG: S-layer family protein [Hydrococcus sp. SU_1_0]|nr:S-layer family protein [Hydrococcus sp. SU_1_0]